MNQRGSALSAVLIIILVIGLIGALAFGLIASSGKSDLQKNVDAKVAVAVEAAKKVQAEELQKAFEEESKSPNKSYSSAVSSGSVSFAYPKTWSAYVIEGGSNNSQPINGYFHPDQVPGVQGETAYALRVELLDTDYSQVVSSFSKQSEGGLKAAAYIPPQMEGVNNVQPGVKFDGAIDDKKNGSLVVIKVRDKTLKIYTESTDFLKDFNDIVLASLTYSP